MSGWKEFNGKKAKKLMDEQVQQANYEAGTAIMAASKQQVPLDEGILQGSGEVYKEPDGNAVALSYGYGSGTSRPKLPYAIRWHEEEANFQHGRKNHYLSDPLKSVGPNALKKALEKQIDEAF